MSNYQTVGQGGVTYVKYSEAQPGQVLAEGTYLTTKAGTYGPQHHFRTETGSTVVLNSSGQLNYRLENFVSRGDQVRIIYNGKVEVTKGKMKGKQAHDFTVQKDSSRHTDLPAEASYDEEDLAPVAAVASYDDEDDSEAETYVAPRAVPSASTDAPKKASAQDILAKYRKKA